MHKILIIAPSWIGDAVMAQALYKLIKERNPAAIIHVLAPSWVIPILDFMPEVDRAIIWPFVHGKLELQQRYLFSKTLRGEHYTQAIVLPNSFKSALIPLWAKIPLRTGWRGEMRYWLLNDVRVLDKIKLPLMVQRFAALALQKKELLPELLPWPKLIIKKNICDSICQKFNLDLSRPILALCPGAEYGEAKRWPAKHFAEVAKNKLNNGWQVWLFGSKKDSTITDAIQKLTNNTCYDFAGKTLLDEATMLLSLSQIVISNDSGLLHIAAALQRPIIALYGSTSPQFAPPLFANARILSLNLKCSPCRKRACPRKNNRYQCLIDLKPQAVLAEIDMLKVK